MMQISGWDESGIEVCGFSGGEPGGVSEVGICATSSIHS